MPAVFCKGLNFPLWTTNWGIALKPPWYSAYTNGVVCVAAAIMFRQTNDERYRELALKGAEVIVCASAFLSPRFDHWEFFLRARATENQCWVVASGQYGVDPLTGIGYVGRSMVVDPWGTIVATASDEEGIITTEIDLNFADEVKRRYPLMDQRRPDLYQHIGKSKDQVPLYK